MPQSPGEGETAEGLPPGAAESVSIDTGWDLYAENGTELHCLSVCGQLFNSHSLEFAINTDWQEQLASPRDTRDQESSTRALLLPPPMGRKTFSLSTASGAPSSTTSAATTQAANNMPLAGPGFPFAQGTDGRITIGASCCIAECAVLSLMASMRTSSLHDRERLDDRHAPPSEQDRARGAGGLSMSPYPSNIARRVKCSAPPIQYEGVFIFFSLSLFLYVYSSFSFSFSSSSSLSLTDSLTRARALSLSLPLSSSQVRMQV